MDISFVSDRFLASLNLAVIVLSKLGVTVRVSRALNLHCAMISRKVPPSPPNLNISLDLDGFKRI